MNLIELSRQFIAVDSTPTNGNEEVAKFAASLATRMGLSAELQYENQSGLKQANVIIKPQEDREVDLLLLTHLDTPDPGSYGLWTQTLSNPFKASIHSDEIFGLGTAKAKLDFLCKLIAMEESKEQLANKNIALVGTYGGELGMDGVLKLLRRKKILPRYALVGEPTELKVRSQGVGLTSLEVSVPFSSEEFEYHQQHNNLESSSTQSKMFSGRAAHASQPEAGDNAIEKMIEYLIELPEGIVVMEMDGGLSFNTVPSSAYIEIDLVGNFSSLITTKIKALHANIQVFKKQFAEYTDPNFDPKVSTLNLGQVRTYQNHIRFLGSCRILPNVPEKVYQKWLLEFKSACEEVGASFRIVSNKKPFSTDKNGSFAQQIKACMEKAKLDTEFYTTTVCTEASVLNAMGVESLVFGPGRGVGNTHEPNERVKINELESAILFYKSVIGEYQ